MTQNELHLLYLALAMFGTMTLPIVLGLFAVSREK